jgi:hypothetical protein
MTNEEALEIVWRCLPLPENAPERLLEAWLTIKVAVLVNESPKLPLIEDVFKFVNDQYAGGASVTRLQGAELAYRYLERQLRAD